MKTFNFICVSNTHLQTFLGAINLYMANPSCYLKENHAAKYVTYLKDLYKPPTFAVYGLNMGYILTARIRKFI